MGNGDIMEYGEFCVEPLAGDMERGRYMIRTCKEKEEKKEDDGGGVKYRFYYIILILSILCLTVTIFLYSVFHTALLKSEYNKIMLNFALCLLLAFLTLVVMQNLDSDTMTPVLCTCLTVSHQFFLLSAFTMMTLMSYDIFKQIRGMSVVRSKGRSRCRQVVAAYSAPATVAILTLIVELTAPHCATIRPKFGFRSCHFYGKLDKFVWLYLPILCLLMVNTAMFIYVARNIWMNSKTGESSSGGNRMERRDKMCLYLRLFIGMGIIWYFEIIAFSFTGTDIGVEWFYFTDTLNMLQGVWVFLIFVCKRNVLKVVTRRAESLYSSVGRHTPAVKERSRTDTARTETTSVSVSRTDTNVSLPATE